MLSLTNRAAFGCLIQVACGEIKAAAASQKLLPLPTELLPAYAAAAATAPTMAASQKRLPPANSGCRRQPLPPPPTPRRLPLCLILHGGGAVVQLGLGHWAHLVHGTGTGSGTGTGTGTGTGCLADT